MGTMSEQATPPTTPPQPPPDRRDLRNLRRSSADRVIAGVCGGLGRYTGVDPVVFRITLAVLAVFGGTGVLLYLLAWLLIPDEGSAHSEAQRIAHGRGPLMTLLAIGVGIIALAAIGGVASNHWGHRWPGPFPAIILFLAIVALVVYRRGQGDPAPTPPERPGGAPLGPPSGYSPSSSSSFSEAPTYAQSPYTQPPYTQPPYTQRDDADEPWLSAPPQPAPAPRRPPSFLGPIGISLAFIVGGVLMALGAAGAVDVTAQAVFAAALLTVGLVLVAGAWFGRSRGLIAWGAVLTAGLVLAAAVNVPLRGGVGNRHDVPVSVSDVSSNYHLGVGNQVLDFAELEMDGATKQVAATLGVGDLNVIVPRDVKVVVHARAGVGELSLFSRDFEGTQLDRTVTVEATGEQSGVLDLDLHVGIGRVEVWQR